MNYIADGYVRSGYVIKDSDTQGSYTFDKYGKFVFVNESVANIELADIYSRSMDWLALDENLKIKPPMKYSGFDTIPTGFTGATFFVYNGWRVIYNTATTAITGVLYSEDYATGYWDKDYNPIFPVTVSAVVNTVSVGSGLSTAENAKLMSLINADFTPTNGLIDDVKLDTEAILLGGTGGGTGTTPQEVWEYANRTLTSNTGGLDEAALHLGLDNYPNKSGYQADITGTNAKIDNIQADTTSLITNVSAIPTESAALSSLDFHTYLDTYSNKLDWYETTADISTGVWTYLGGRQVDTTGSTSSGLTAAENTQLMSINVGFTPIEKNRFTKFFTY